MKKYFDRFVVAALAASATLFAVEKEEILPAPVKALDFFKTGLTVVRRQITPPEDGKPFYFSGEISPAYGTFWIFSDEAVTIAAKEETVLTNNGPLMADIPYYLRFKGQQGRVWFKTDLANFEETLKWLASGEAAEQFLTVPPPESERGAKTYKADGVIEGRSGQDLVLRLANKAALRIPLESVTLVSGKEDQELKKSKIKLWRVTGAKKPFFVEYLTSGMTWAPSYRLELDKDGKSYLSMAADLRNDFEEIKDTDLTLVSGQPTLQFKNTSSLLDLRITPESFFRSVGWGFEQPIVRKLDYAKRPLNKPVAMPGAKAKASYSAMGAAKESAAMDVAMADEEVVVEEMVVDMPAAAAGFADTGKEQGADISYVSIGKHSLEKGAAAHIPCGTAEVEVERKAEWKIEPRRYLNGVPVPEYEGSGVQTLYDTLSFKNPFSFPLTEGAMEVTEGGHIYSQSMREWINPGQKVSMNLTKALSLTGKVEESVDKKAKQVKRRKKIDGENVEGYEKKVNGKLTLHNYRGTAAKVKITLNVYGDLEKFAIPEDKLVESKDKENDLNTLRERTWEMEVPAGGEEVFEYHYTVFEAK